MCFELSAKSMFNSRSSTFNKNKRLFDNVCGGAQKSIQQKFRNETKKCQKLALFYFK